MVVEDQLHSFLFPEKQYNVKENGHSFHNDNHIIHMKFLHLYASVERFETINTFAKYNCRIE